MILEYIRRTFGEVVREDSSPRSGQRLTRLEDSSFCVTFIQHISEEVLKYHLKQSLPADSGSA